MQKAGAKTLAMEARRTLIIDEKEVTAMADKSGISVCALESDPQ